MDRSRDLFWNRNKPKALLKVQEYENPGRAAFAAIDKAFVVRQDPEEIEFEEHLGNTVSTVITISSEYEDPVVEEFLDIIQEMTGVSIECVKVTDSEDDFVGSNKQFRIDIEYNDDENSSRFFCSIR